ncbi:MAG: hypothetical protein JWO62_1349, partial [Acidimicrobiaceae bacterium]|nr:hypothetical protein [Acidimicrobiaceae bacterium]
PSGGSPSTQAFVWNTLGSVPQLLMDGKNAYLYGPGSTPVEQVNLSSGTIQYLASDALGSVRGVVSASGALTSSTAYGAYGTPETSGGLTSYTPFGFAGGYTDPTGLVYLVNRYYDPGTGQFLSVDPLVDQTGLPYGYTGGNPVNGVDPLGLSILDPSWVHTAWNDTGGVVVHGVKVAATDTGSWVYANASNLSTITSALAALAYATCAVTAGAGCGVGVALSATSTSLAALNTYRACSSNQGCASAAVGLGLSLVATGAGISLQRALASALSLENTYAKDIYLARQAGVVGAGLNGLDALYGAAQKAYAEFKSLGQSQCRP